MIIESKVLLPAVAGFVGATLSLAAAFGLDLTQDQQTAILGVTVALLVLVQAVLGYLAPHTARPDLDGHQEPQGRSWQPQGDGGYTLVEVGVFLVLVVLAVVLAVRFL